MKRFLYFISIVFVFFIPVKSVGQLNHFIYLQSENKQPFYVKMNKTIYNSTVSGYLIIPKLQDGTYNFHLGFVNSTQNNEYEFSCSISNRDMGYLVKNFSDKGWGLFNLQSLQVVMSGTREQEVAQTSKTDAFSNLLSDVVNDPSIKQENIVKQPEKEKKEEQQIVSEPQKSESLRVVASNPQDSTTKVDTPVLNKTVVNSITKHEVLNTAEGLSITYLDSSYNGTTDTITIFMPAMPVLVDTVIKEDKQELLQQPEKPVAESEGKKVNNEPAKQSSVDTQSGKNSNKESSTKFLEIDLPSEQAKTDSSTIKTGTSKPLTANTNALMINSDCKTIASEEDFMKLRRKMASARSVEEMITSAKKTFRSKCFTTDQVKNLGVLFLKDADRYNFFDIAYPFVSDSNNFKLLEDQLTDAYYKARFQAMIRH